MNGRDAPVLRPARVLVDGRGPPLGPGLVVLRALPPWSVVAPGRRRGLGGLIGTF